MPKEKNDLRFIIHAKCFTCRYRCRTVEVEELGDDVAVCMMVPARLVPKIVQCQDDPDLIDLSRTLCNWFMDFGAQDKILTLSTLVGELERDIVKTADKLDPL